MLSLALQSVNVLGNSLSFVVIARREFGTSTNFDDTAMVEHEDIVDGSSPIMKKRTRSIAMAAVAGGLLIAVGAWELHAIGLRREHNRAEPLPVPARFVKVDVVEPSGVTYHPQRGTLLIVSDEGGIAELNDDFEVINRFPLPGDLEGIAVDPSTAMVWVAAEDEGVVYLYDLSKRRVHRKYQVDFSSHADFAKGLRWNSGLEGVTVLSHPGKRDRILAVVEAHPARLIELAITPESPTGDDVSVAIESAKDVGLRRLSDVLFEPVTGLLLFTSAGSRTLSLCTTAGDVIRTFQLPGRKPEGLCFLPNGDGIVVQDTGGLWVCKALRQSLLPASGR